MVVIEVEEDEQEKNSNNHSNPPISKGATSNADASDGFETASEAELGSDDDDHQERAVVDPGAGHDHHPQEQESGVPPKTDDSSGEALSEDELIQKALVQVNDAKVEGNELFKDGLYEKALLKYELALQAAKDMPSFVEVRSICHSNRAICFLKLGKYTDTIKECTKALELNPTYIKALVRRGEAHEKLEHFEEALSDMKKILEIDPSNEPARKSILRLQPLAEEKREKMKEEMIAKLKDLGNSVLGRFGMSVDNFKAVKDPNTGSYSISFQK